MMVNTVFGLVAGMFGGLLGGWWANYFGRCVVMLTSCLEVCDFETYVFDAIDTAGRPLTSR